MKPIRIAMLLLGILLALPAAIAVFGGGSLLAAYLIERDDDNYLDVTLDRIESPAPAVTGEDIDLESDPGDPDWLLNSIDLDVRLRVTPAISDQAIFIGIAPEEDVDAFLAGTAHDEIIDVDDDLTPEYRSRSGDTVASDPTIETFWTESSTGVGTQEIVWEPRVGNWAVVVMNADGTAGISVDANVGARADWFLALLIVPIVAGLIVGALALTLIVSAGRGDRAELATDPATPSPATPNGITTAALPESGSPVRLEATLDPLLSNWLWLVKWILAIPHFIILAFFWIAFPFLTIAAGLAILFTGRYPRGLFAVTEGIMRWTWRVSYYAANGGIGTDEYPPFSIYEQPGDYATLNVRYPEKLERPLVLVKWLLAIPHLLIVGILVGSSFGWSQEVDFLFSGGLLGLLSLAAGVTLLLTRRYPPALFDLIIGLNRWVYRTVAYVGLMTDDYPPFRLDQGGSEPSPPPNDPPPPDGGAIDVTDESPAHDLHATGVPSM